MSNADRVFILEVTQPSGVKTHYVKTPTFVLGRSSTSAIKFDDNNISREHIKIFFDDVIKIQDLNSSNGTFVNGKRLDAMVDFALSNDDRIFLGGSEISFQIKIFTPQDEVKAFVQKAEVEEEKAEVKVKITGFPTTEQELKLDFKNIKLDLPKYRDPGEHAREIVTEANYVKYTIIKGAITQKEKIINEANLQSKILADKAYQEYHKRINQLISETKIQMQRLKSDTESHLDDKRTHAMKEIDHLWKEHQEQIDIEKKSILAKLEIQNKREYDIEIERLKNDIFVEKNKLLTEAESTIMQNTAEYRSKFENEKIEHNEKINLLSKEVSQLKAEHENLVQKIEFFKDESRAKQIEFDKAVSNLKIENDKLEIAQKTHDDLKKETSKIQGNIDNYTKNLDAALESERQANRSFEELNLKIAKLNEKKEDISQEIAELEKTIIDSKVKVKTEIENEHKLLKEINSKKIELKDETEKLELVQKTHDDLKNESARIQVNIDNCTKSLDAALEAEKQANKSIEELTLKISNLSEKKEDISEQVVQLEKALADSKFKAKVEVESEYKLLKEIEAKKFEEFKVVELKDLQKIREEHTGSFRKFSLELSQEIATKLEMQQKSGQAFNFEKHLEIINSVIQVKSSAVAGVAPEHQSQLDSWKRKQRTEKSSLFVSGAVASVLIYISGNFLYTKFSTNSLQQEQALAAEKRRQNEIENKFVPEKTSKIHESYVDSTLYTENFSEVYLDDSLQNEWVKKSTVYFLNTWKIDEQKTIQVIANSKSLVQNIVEASTKLTKTNLKKELKKLKDLEDQNVKMQVEILGTNVKYEAFKKLELNFFTEKLKKRSLANE